jgi:hypothetical protein
MLSLPTEYGRTRERADKRLECSKMHYLIREWCSISYQFGILCRVYLILSIVYTRMILVSLSTRSLSHTQFSFPFCAIHAEQYPVYEQPMYFFVSNNKNSSNIKEIMIYKRMPSGIAPKMHSLCRV